MSKNTQSVILNLNQNYANSKAHNYFQPVSQQLQINENAEVALYGASIKRQPIFIDKDKENNTFNFDIDPVVFPDNRQINLASSTATHVLDEDRLPKASIEEFANGFEIRSGAFSIQEFGETLVNNINYNITDKVNGQNLLANSDDSVLTVDSLNIVKQFPYGYTYENDKPDDFYLGFQGMPYQGSGLDSKIAQLGELNNSQEGVSDNTEAIGTSGALELKYDTEGFSNTDGCRRITANVAIDTTDYQSFSQIHFAPVFPLFRQQKDLEPVSTAGQNESYFEFNINTSTAHSDNTTDIFVGFTNTFLQSGWTTTTVPATVTLFPDASNGPQSFLGVKINEVFTSGSLETCSAEVFLANKITGFQEYLRHMNRLSEVFQDGLGRLCKIDLNIRLNEVGKMGFRFYAVDNQYNYFRGQETQQQGGNNPNGIDSSNRVYPRVYGFQFYVRPEPGAREIVYDSKNDNIYIPSYYLEDGFCYNAARSQRDALERCNLGFMPYLFVNKLAAGDGIASPRGNYIAQQDNSQGEVVYRYGCDYFKYESNNRDLLNVLGIPKERSQVTEIANAPAATKYTKTIEKRYDINAYPEFKKLAGNTKLYTDNIQYNIEVNLPIRCYNTIEPKKNNTSSVPGQKRTILYKTEPIIEGEVQGIDQYYLDKNIVPNTLKYLTLNNSAKLNMNELNIQIRRSKTNELATELEDASVELLIKSE